MEAVKRYKLDGKLLTAEQYVKAMKAKYNYEGDLPPMLTGIRGVDPEGGIVKGTVELPPDQRPAWDEYRQLEEIVSPTDTELDRRDSVAKKHQSA
jgi:hypothetical protein